MVFIVGAVCLVVGQLLGWWLGYGRGKKDALNEVGRMEEYNRRRKLAASQKGSKGPVKAGQGSPGQGKSSQGRNRKR